MLRLTRFPTIVKQALLWTLHFGRYYRMPAWSQGIFHGCRYWTPNIFLAPVWNYRSNERRRNLQSVTTRSRQYTYYSICALYERLRVEYNCNPVSIFGQRLVVQSIASDTTADEVKTKPCFQMFQMKTREKIHYFAYSLAPQNPHIILWLHKIL